jgi:hypothetical protein
MKMKKRMIRLTGFLLSCVLILFVTLSCSFPVSDPQIEGLEQTRVALEVLLTRQAIDAQLTQPAALLATQNAQMTAFASQATEIAQQAAIATVAPLEVQVTPTLEVTPTANINLQIRAAKILLYENMSGEKIYDLYHPRYVQAALDRGGYSYTNVGSALGWFKDNLLNQPEWDLIIASSEAHNKLSGEYFTYILDHINRGSAFILEIWDLDDMSGGTIAPILKQCGVEVYADWVNLSNIVIWPLIPDHPIFHYPNEGISLKSGEPFWPDDHGDLLKISGTGDAQFVGGTMQSQLADHGLITTCLGGRMIIQSFRSHDLTRYDMENLWENYINFALKSKFGG